MVSVFQVGQHPPSTGLHVYTLPCSKAWVLLPMLVDIARHWFRRATGSSRTSPLT